MKQVAIQGQKASFHDIAARQFFGSDIELVSCDTFTDTFAAVKDGRASVAVCAIENSLYGSINETYDLLVKNHFLITGEVYLHIEQCLIGLPGTKLEDITEVYSHPVALAQCDEYLDVHLPDAQRLEGHDTAGSVAHVKELGRSSAAAIASRAAADFYGLEVLVAGIETNKQNYTRFIVLEPSASTQTTTPDANKTSLILKTSHAPGALYHALGAFADQNINLSKLQSRPIIGKAWHYLFYIDVDAGLNNPSLTAALKALESQECEVTVLGTYHAAVNTGNTSPVTPKS